MSDDKKHPVVSKEVVDNVFTSENGWATVYDGPIITWELGQIYINYSWENLK
jgi:hypothetical protein